MLELDLLDNTKNGVNSVKQIIHTVTIDFSLFKLKFFFSNIKVTTVITLNN